MNREELLKQAKPILFNTEMVKAILDGRKTQTRRVVKPFRLQPYHIDDILYVRETWTECHIASPDKYLYRADYDTNKYPYSKWSWHPSIHMPKEAARIFLKVTDVRVERLRNIRVDGVHKEGVDISTEPFERFNTLWDSTVKDRDKYGWKANPYVWVIEFERVTE